MYNRHAAALAVVAISLLVLALTWAAFRAWVTHRFGYLDLDMVGRSALAWPGLALLATFFAWLAFHVRWARFVAIASLAVLAAVVLDQLAGALRNGAVSPPGAITGLLMATQCATLGVGVALSARPSWSGRWIVVPVAVALLTAPLVGAAAATVATTPEAPLPAGLGAHVEPGRRSIEDHLDLLEPGTGLVLIGARCRTDGGAVLLYRTWWLGLIERTAYVLIPAEAEPGLYAGGMLSEPYDPEIGAFLGSHEVICEAPG